mgnify:FL=1|jgi:DNA repair protein RecN (Recombination protein N)
MINILHIKNIGIIDELTINLNGGFNVLTGETGAGKTLIIDSLNVISGGRFSKEMIRKGEEYSFVEAQIFNEKSEENIIVSREINLKGRNICKINGRLVTVAELKEFMSKKIDIHGQNDNLNLLDTNNQIEYLDNFTAEEIHELKDNYRSIYEKYLYVKNELNSNYGDEKEKQRKLDLLRYQVNEIEEANLKVGEEEELENENKLINNSEKIYNNLYKANELIENSAIESISTAVRNMEKIEEYSKEYENISKALKSLYYDLQEINRDLQDSNNDIYFDENKKIEIAERLDLIYTLKRKYGNNIQEILAYKNELEKEIQQIEGLEDYINKLNTQKQELEIKMKKIAEELNIIRNKNAVKLSKCINKELKDLEMANSEFNVEVKYLENEFNKNGLNSVEFKIRTNIGEDMKSLAKVASGGENSRIMLAIKKVLADVDKTETLVFDEIDTGISGLAADKVGEKLKIISNKHQVLIVTHLANIAAKGDYNYYIHKEVEENKTKTKIDLLNEEQTLKEVARIASGKITKETIEHAKILRGENKKIA